MKVTRKDIDPDGDILIVLKRPNSLHLMPHLFMEEFPWPPSYYGSILVDLPNKDEVQIEFRVSSLNMIRSSIFFKAMLEGPWKEAVEASASPPHLHIVSATDWNADALATVLKIIHDHSYENDLPDDMSNFFLVHIAAIVDYYQCTQCLRIKAATRQWKRGFTEGLDKTSLLVDLYIAQVFSCEYLYLKLLRLAFEYRYELRVVDTAHDLPIEEALETIEKKKKEATNKLLARIDAMAPEIWKVREDCTDKCYRPMRKMLPKVFVRIPLSHSLVGYTLDSLLSFIDILPPAGFNHSENCSVKAMIREATIMASQDVEEACLEIVKGKRQ